MNYQILYSSRAVRPMKPAELESILVEARRDNEARGITGALVYADGVFLQVVEGDHDVVDALVAQIREDSRHADMKVFHRAEAPERAFSDWRMAYLDTDVDEMSRWAGLEGTGTIDDLVGHLHRDAHRVPRILVRIAEALAGKARRG